MFGMFMTIIIIGYVGYYGYNIIHDLYFDKIGEIVILKRNLEILPYMRQMKITVRKRTQK